MILTDLTETDGTIPDHARPDRIGTTETGFDGTSIAAQTRV